MADADLDRRDMGFGGLARRERLERIAGAERDRRSGRHAMAAAAVGEPNEWPARVVLALVRLASSDVDGARRLLEQGLDRWARELGLTPLDASDSSSPAPDGAVDADELDRAFSEARAELDQMVDVNRVAARVLMEEPIGLAELSGEAGEAFGITQPSLAAPESRSVVLATLERWLHNLERRGLQRGRGEFLGS